MELYLEPEWVQRKRNPISGQFLPGHVPHNKGKHHCPEGCEKGWFRKGHKPQNKPAINQPHSKRIAMYCNGVFVRDFRSISYAAVETGICRENIGKCVSGKRPTAGGFRWVFLN